MSADYNYAAIITAEQINTEGQWHPKGTWSSCNLCKTPGAVVCLAPGLSAGANAKFHATAVCTQWFPPQRHPEGFLAPGVVGMGRWNQAELQGAERAGDRGSTLSHPWVQPPRMWWGMLGCCCSSTFPNLSLNGWVPAPPHQPLPARLLPWHTRAQRLPGTCQWRGGHPAVPCHLLVL